MKERRTWRTLVIFSLKGLGHRVPVDDRRRRSMYFELRSHSGEIILGARDVAKRSAEAEGGGEDGGDAGEQDAQRWWAYYKCSGVSK